ncbi:uncharacterized protein LOC123556686 [Mercenaria mercenaria]|uniref:uncharacterized protein LOC123556686 n=1 Tax=Mercenaria mercenaria TaxID=6596 RepID=UPI00234F70EA|nr:uncharacterized protein LOC123556686 [Mercenaria mercenaria]XP_045203546.2 uncharacterized protein LOC123556686 [Mercenaria mercenaria]XP_045203552.2 uncharacterized protein LOC123556686 [Mercenaria mercenaria]XP_045203561.2 uncharacterized protein LOC123556686 [Mercenaria mercenaria]
MDTGRVGACHKLENKRRKFLIVINDVVKNKYDVYAEYLDHSHSELEHNFEKSKMFVRRALVRQKVLQKCMKMRRRNVHMEDQRSVFGRYGGKPIESFGKDIEKFMAYNHPKMRRQRYLQKMLNESLDKGTILKQNVIEDRVAGWMERSYTKYKLKKAKREKTKLEPIKEKKERSVDKRSMQLRLPVLTNPFYSGARETEAEISTSVDADVLKITEDMEKVNIEKETEKPETKVEKRATLVLPPIRPTKAMVAT